MDPIESEANLRSQFLEVLRSRRSPLVPLQTLPAKCVVEPLYQGTPCDYEAMKSVPKAPIHNFKEENFYLITEEGEQGQLPVLILSKKESTHSKRPAVVFLHSSHTCKEWVRPLLELPLILVTMENVPKPPPPMKMLWFHHGKKVWDLLTLVDYLTAREDIDNSKIGILGMSLGGMHAWFAAFADTRYSVVVPIISVQSFRWALDNDQWHARVYSIKSVFEEARIDLGKDTIDKEVVEKVWNRIAPGLASEFDSHHTVPVIAVRPLLIINGEVDPRCPLEGLDATISTTQKAFDAHSLTHFKVIVEPGIGHEVTLSMLKEASDWFDKFLKP
ncbi:uncharacterized protein LOC111902733 isoform X2 [Lactuca sativa]|uniref:uncharacterized protein LOC111902733 isoform X2 n=1 Tax=Lactuca sativa TaxID=4236 RepID=UPI0022AF81EB|nr:uncharacterized protein LOC111902733 isoform X2 [Lactuca sativa]